jgi:hypothetical protein
MLQKSATQRYLIELLKLITKKILISISFIKKACSKNEQTFKLFL